MKKKNYIIVSIIIVLLTSSAYFLGSATSKNKNVESKIEKTGRMGFSPNGDMPSFDRSNTGGTSGKRMFQGKFVNGEVISNDGTVMTIKLENGGSRIVLTSQATKFNKNIEANIQDVSAGKTVMITGESNPDGSMIANNIQIK